MTHFTTSRAFVALSMLWVISSVARADEHFVPLDGSDARLEPSDFGCQINKITEGGRGASVFHSRRGSREELSRSPIAARKRWEDGGGNNGGFCGYHLWSWQIQCRH